MKLKDLRLDENISNYTNGWRVKSLEKSSNARQQEYDKQQASRRKANIYKVPVRVVPSSTPPPSSTPIKKPHEDVVRAALISLGYTLVSDQNARIARIPDTFTGTKEEATRIAIR